MSTDKLASGSIPASPEPEQVRQPTALPCPFCGGSARFVEYYDGNSFIECNECGAEAGYSRPYEKESEMNAIAKWNQRSAIEPSTSVSTEAQNEAKL